MTTQTHPSITHSDTQPDPAALIRWTLRGNVIFCVAMCLLVFFGMDGIAAYIGFDDVMLFNFISGRAFLMFLVVGVGLFAAFVAYTAYSQPFERTYAWAIFVLDIAWVVVSWLLLATQALPLTTQGSWAVLIVADIVLLFGIVEFVGLRRLNKYAAA